ncbi:FtsK/SpoIIIE domain-containing protein [Actinomyces oricola]
MRIRLSVAGRSGQTTNLQITADATATVGDVAAALASAGPIKAGAAVAPATMTLRVLDAAGLRPPLLLAGHTPLDEAGLRSGDLVDVSPVTEDHSPSAEAAVVQVLSGPDAGTTHPITFGSTEVGRSRSCGVVLTDPLVSERHMRITVGQGIEIHDLNSANGVVVSDQRVQRLRLGPHDRITVGDTMMRISMLTTASSVPGARKGGDNAEIAFVRSPRVVPRTPEASVALPEAPRTRSRNRFPLLAMAAPLLMGAAMLIMTRNALSLIFVLLSPLIMVGNWVDQDIRRKRGLKQDIALFTEGVAQAVRDLRAAHAAERAARISQYPPVATVLDQALAMGPMLWWRRPEHPEFLQLRLGVGTDVPRTKVEEGHSRDGLAIHQQALAQVRARFATIDEVPIVVNLREDGSLGLCGAGPQVEPVARAVLAQLVCLHSPAEVAVVCLTDPTGRERWDWLEWLPHSCSPHSPLGDLHLACDGVVGGVLLARLEELMTQRGATSPARRGPSENSSDDEGDEPTVPAVVVVADNPGVDRARLMRVVEQGPDVGIHTIWVAPEVTDLPAACRTFLRVTSQGGQVGYVRRSRTATQVAPETLTHPQVRRLGRHLAPVVDGGVPVDDESDLPRAISFVGLTGEALADSAEAQVARWRANHSIIDHQGPAAPLKQPVSLRALVGQGAEAPLALDLRAHGPHALVGGTTGAGKSEFLQSWVLGMAQALSPDRVTFLFVDYKGGSAFARCTDLPHCVGLVTDLSPYLVRRALTSLRAELRYREHLLNDKGVKDLVTLEKTGDPDCPPSLIIVVDEFAALVGEVPEFVDGVVDVAQRGRSLGLHLVLATQRPAGVIKDNLRANTNLRVALRMADESDSQDVLGERIAAHFPPEIPGRGAAKTGPGRITQFQSAYPGARTSAQKQAAQVAVDEMTFGAPRPWQVARMEQDTESVPQDIDRVVATIVRASQRAGIAAPRKPWLEELATTYDLNRLPQRRDTELLLGVVDDPDHQDQHPEYFRPDDEGNICFYGSSGSGKSTALRSLAIAAAITPRSGPVNVYALDFGGGGLRMLESLPHVGAVVDGDDEERVQRLLSMLADTVDERGERYAQARAATITDYRRIADRRAEPRILLLVDGIGSMRTEYEKSADGLAVLEVLQRLLVDGRGVGVHVAVTAERPQAVPTSMSGTFQRKVVLRQTDEDGYMYFGLPKDVLTPASPPGRAMQVGRKDEELQLAILGDNINVLSQSRLVDAFGHYLERQGRTRPAGVGRLPAELPAGELPATVAGRPTLGMSSDTLGPMGFEPVGALLLAGQPQSGTSNAMRWMATTLRQWDPNVVRVHMAARRSPLAHLEGLWDLSVSGEESIRETLTKLSETLGAEAEPGRPQVALFIEGYPEFLQTPVEMGLIDAVKKVKRNGHLVIAEGETSQWNSSWPLLQEVRSGRTGLILQPESMDGDMILRTATPKVRRGEMPPGRGYWIGAGKAVKVQVPLME